MVWDSDIKERFLAQLRAEGLIGRGRTPAVNRRHYALQAGPVWEARYRTSGGKELFRRFSINKHGEAMAKQLAEQAYARLVAEFSTSVTATPSKRKNTKSPSPKH